MSKSIIIIDTPKTCAECRASYCADIWYCYGGSYRRMLTSNEIYAKPDWCPLKEILEDDDSIPISWIKTYALSTGKAFLPFNAMINEWRRINGQQ